MNREAQRDFEAKTWPKSIPSPIILTLRVHVPNKLGTWDLGSSNSSTGSGKYMIIRHWTLRVICWAPRLQHNENRPFRSLKGSDTSRYQLPSMKKGHAGDSSHHEYHGLMNTMAQSHRRTNYSFRLCAKLRLEISGMIVRSPLQDICMKSRVGPSDPLP